MPRRRVPYRGRELEEMDLDRLLKRRPQLALVDELAHENAPGSRHPKRWMDVLELLAAGIDVWTTMNVQHVESLNDVVAQITHVRVRETVPDSVLDQAEIELIDLTPDELRERLHEGKVYVPEAATRALDHYFSPGNLTALRELALRRTAERVDDQMVQYMRAHGLAGPWAARRAAAGLRAWRRGCRRAGPLHQAPGRPPARRPGRRCMSRPPPTAAPAMPPTIGWRTRCAWPSGWVARPWSFPASGSPRRSWPGRAPTTSPRSSSAACAARAGATGSSGSLPRELIRGADDIVVLVLPEGGETAPPKTRSATRA